MTKKTSKIILLLTDNNLSAEIEGKRGDLVALLGAVIMKNEEFRELLADTMMAVCSMELEKQGIDLQAIIDQAITHHAHEQRNPFQLQPLKKKVVN